MLRGDLCRAAAALAGYNAFYQPSACLSLAEPHTGSCAAFDAVYGGRTFVHCIYDFLLGHFLTPADDNVFHRFASSVPARQPLHAAHPVDVFVRDGQTRTARQLILRRYAGVLHARVDVFFLQIISAQLVRVTPHDRSLLVRPAWHRAAAV